MEPTNRGDNENERKNLSELFVTSPEEAISQAKLYLMAPDFTNYEEYIEDVKKTQKSNCCIVSWSKSMLSARCLDCQLQANSCICIPCYLAGKHDQHHSYLLGGSGSGNCDCGDPNFWKPEGNCPNHPGPDPNPEVTQMTLENRTKFVKLFKIAYTSALNTDNGDFSIQIFEWLTNFISIGDGLRRCVAIAVCSTPEETFFNKLQDLDKDPLKSLLNLFGKLVSDHHFAQIMGSIALKNYLFLKSLIKSELMKDHYDKKVIPFYPIKKFLGFSFHFFNMAPLMYLVENHNFDWVDFVINCIKFTLETIKECEMNYDKNMDGQLSSHLWYMTKLLEGLLKKDDQHENIQRFIDSYSSLLVDYERFYTFNFPRSKEEDSRSPYTAMFLFIYLYQINSLFSPNFDQSPKNKTFSIAKTFSNLLNFLRSNEDLKSTSLFGQKAVPISSFLPLHHFFYCLFSSHSDPLIVIAKECSENNISVQEFCCLSSICPLRILTAISVHERFSLLNSASRRNITYCLDKPEESYNAFFGLVQSMLAFVENKEEILYMIMETFGVFNDYQISPKSVSDKRLMMKLVMDYQNQLEKRNSNIFDASTFIVSLITDQSIRTYDKVLFKRLCVIELLMNHKPTAKDIENYVDDKLSNPIFGDDLQSYAERVSTSNGSFFRLKDQSEFTPFFPLISRKNRMKILMNYGDKLVKVPELDKTQQPLLPCLNTPTFIAAMHSCLTRKEMHFKQVGLAMFVLIVKNNPNFSYTLKKAPIPIQISSSSDLIFCLSSIYKISPDFNPLMTIIESDEDNKKQSIVEIVQSMGQIGYEAITKADLPDFLKPKMDDNNDQMQKEKREKAANIKKALMKEFENKRSQFSAGGISTTTTTKDDDDDDDDDDDIGASSSAQKSSNVQNDHSSQKKESSEIMCNICQTKVTDDVIGFPCLSLPSVLPHLVRCILHKNLDENINSLDCVTSLSICHHHVHSRCCLGLIKEFKNDRGDKNDEHTYNCMIDRGIRNCFLPLFEDSFNFGQQPPKPLQDSIDLFMKTTFNIDEESNKEEEEEDDDDDDKEKDRDLLLKPLKSFAGQVSILEVRHRSRPECLDSPTVPSLLRSLLHTIYACIHKKSDSIEVDSTTKLTDPLLALVIELVKSKNPISEHSNIVKNLSNGFLDKNFDYLYEFLRGAAIIEEFALKSVKKSSKSGLIDWDELLSLEKLVERYNIDFDLNKNMVELPLFETIPLAERFVGLYQPPYNMDIFDTSISKFVDLLTGKVVFFSRSQVEIPERPDLPHITTYVENQYKRGVAMFLGLTGSNASDIIISCPAINKIFNLDGFYVDQFGDIDRGFKRGAILSLSKDRLENALDKYLSGDVILY